jgi:LuxR family glucitol operon transcriptional activator
MILLILRGAIQTSLGILADIQKTITGKTSEASLSEILEYLNTFRIFLVIDNLETVLDKRMLDFLSSLNGNSKVLITSLVGTGEMNYPFPLGPMTENEAVQLLRATAQVRGVQSLAKAKTDVLKAYCQRMKCNPAYIKWFVSGIQCGKRPEDVFANSKVFLDFCLSNVYDYVNDDAKTIADVMIAVPGKHAQPVLSYISEIEGDSFKEALRQLWTTNIVVMSSLLTEAGTESVYDLNPLPRAYILKNHPPKPGMVKLYQEKKRRINEMHERMKRQEEVDRYNPRFIYRRTKDDTVIAKYLSDAIAAALKSRFEVAFTFIERAKSLSPAFYEVYRVEAWVNRLNGNYPAALDCYETAIECEGHSAPLRLWYGGFLLRDSGDPEAACHQLQAAHQLDPDSLSVKLELARVLMILEKFDDAEPILEAAVKVDGVSTIFRRKVYDVWCQLEVRRASRRLQDGCHLEALDSCEHLLRKFESIPRTFVDSRMIRSTLRVIPLLDRLDTSLSESDQLFRIEECLHAFANIENEFYECMNDRPEGEELDVHDDDHPENDGEIVSGSICKLFMDRKFGFIAYKGQEVFFHFSRLSGSGITQLKFGEEVEFRLCVIGERLSAKDVRLVNESPSHVPSGVLVGCVKSLSDKGSFGFIFAESGDEYFFHKNNLETPSEFYQMKPGMRVQFGFATNAKGVVADKVRCLDS